MGEASGGDVSEKMETDRNSLCREPRAGVGQACGAEGASATVESSPEAVARVG